MAGTLNDLWRFNLASRDWTWIGGSPVSKVAGNYGTRGIETSGNQPPPRVYHSLVYHRAMDALVVFGGQRARSFGSAIDPLNDLWKWNPATGYWTWLSGRNVTGEADVFGAVGVADAKNVPGSRSGQTLTVDPISGALLLFGGYRVRSATLNGLTSVVSEALNDLWIFDPITAVWTWLAGSSEPNRDGDYLQWRTPFHNGFVGARYRHAMVIQNATGSLMTAKILIFGGQCREETDFEGTVFFSDADD